MATIKLSLRVERAAEALFDDGNLRGRLSGPHGCDIDAGGDLIASVTAGEDYASAEVTALGAGEALPCLWRD